MEVRMEADPPTFRTSRVEGAWYLGLDLGGTNLRAVAATPDGAIAWKRLEPVVHDPSDSPPFTQLAEMVSGATGAVGSPPEGIGLGASGPLDLHRGMIENDVTLPPHLNGPVRDELEGLFDRPVTLLNDADAAALGESLLGAAKDADLCVTVTLGTGVGVGVVRAGEIVLGAEDWHAEGGHAVVDLDGPPCTCGGRGCWESICSGPAIEAAVAQRTGSRLPPERLRLAAEAGDGDVLVVLGRAGEALGAGLINILAFIAPAVIVLTGSVLGYGDFLLAPALRRVAEAKVHRPERVSIRTGELGGLAGAIGASQAARMMAGSR
jgi:glucokinase